MSNEAVIRGPSISRLVDCVFGFDFFLSYNHGDGKIYPSRLKRQLERAGFRIFLDQTEYVAGLDLRRETPRQVRRSRKLVVIGRAGALKSNWVKREVDIALADGKIPVVININGAVEAAADDAALAVMARDQHWLRLNETLGDHDEDSPSENTISELIRGFDHTRQETKRQRFFAIAAGVFAIAAFVAAWQAFEANRARIVAETQRDRAQRVLDQIVAAGNRSVQALSLQVEKARDKAATDGLAEPPPPTSLSGSALDQAKSLISKGIGLSERGDLDGARVQFTGALSILSSPSVAAPETIRDPVGLVAAYDQLANVGQKMGDSQIELRALADALSIVGKMTATEPPSPEWKEREALLHLRMGTRLLTKQPSEADQHLGAAVALLRKLAADQPQPPKMREALADALSTLGDLRMVQQQPAAALLMYQESLAINQQILAVNPSEANARSAQSVVLQRITDVFIEMKNPKEGLPWADRDVALSRELSTLSPDDAVLKRDLASSYERRAHILALLGENQSAIRIYQDGIDELETVTSRDDAQPMWRRDVAAMLESQATLSATIDPEGAIAGFKRALSIREALAASQEAPSWQKEVETSYRRLTELMQNLGRDVEALEIAEQYVLATIVSPDRQDYRADRIGRALGTLCWAAINARNFPRAVWAGKAATVLAPNRDFVWLNYAHALMFAGDREAARAIYRDGPPGQNSGAEQKEDRLKQWRASIAKDFDELQQHNLEDNLMGQIRLELGL